MADETRAAGFEVSTDFVYASSCRTEVKEYVMGQQMMEHELPVTVKELGKLLIHFYPIFQDVLVHFLAYFAGMYLKCQVFCLLS